MCDNSLGIFGNESLILEKVFEEDFLISSFQYLLFTELSQCSLVIIFETVFKEIGLLNMLINSSNPKQIVEVSDSGKAISLEKIMWASNSCFVIFFFVTNGKTFLNLYNDSNFFWNYNAKLVVATVSDENLKEIFGCQKALKTNHILVFTLGVCGKWNVFSKDFSDPKKPKLLTRQKRPPFVSFFDEEKFLNFEGAEIKVVNFEWAPNIFYVRDENGTIIDKYGMDVFVMETVAHKLNFTLKYLEPKPNEFWGVSQSDGDINGMIGMVKRGEGNIGIANTFVTYQGDLHIDYSTAYRYEPSCFMSLMSKPAPMWRSVFLPFELLSWIAIVLVVIFIGCVISLFDYVTSSIPSTELEEKSLDIGFSSFMIALQSHLRQSITKRLKKNSVKVLLIFLWIYCIILTTCYSSKLTSLLTIQRRTKEINTIAELRHSKLKVFILGGFYKNTLSSSADSNLRSLVDRLVIVDDLEAIFRSVTKGEGVLLQGLQSLQHYTTTKMYKWQKDPQTTLRIMKECFAAYYIGMYLEPNSPYKKTFDRVIVRLFEGGIVARGFREALQRARKETKMIFENEKAGNENEEKEETETSDQNVILTTEHLQGVFMIYGIALSFALFAFFSEVIVHKLQKA